MAHVKRILFLSCALLLVSIDALAQSPSPSEWQRYTGSGEEFSVNLPILPAADTEDRYIFRLQAKRRERQIGAYADGVAYVIFSYENPKPRQSLESFIEEQSRRDSGPAPAERDLKGDGFVGKAFEGDIWVVQYFATERHLYRFGAYGAAPNDPRITRFFSSLQLGKKREDGKEVSDGPGLPFEPDNSPDGTAPTSYTGKQVDRKARLVMKPEPRYTESARMNKITGTVVLKCIFSSNGMVNNIVTVSGLPYGLTEQAIKAARKIKFVPAMKDGKYVSMWMQLEYNFNLYNFNLH
jgi:TonB family protein